MNLLTASRLKTARECAAKERLAYRDGWRPVREGEALRFGTLMHFALEQWWLTRGDLAAAESAIDSTLNAETDLFNFQKAKEMLRAYHARWFADLELYDVLDVEVEFRAPLINPETMRASRTWGLAGKIDAILRRRSDGHVVVREFKTTSEEIEHDSENYWLRLSMDSQISFYIIGGEALGHTIDEALYDVMRKPGLRPLEATPEDKRKYRADGKLYATQREISETPEEYGARIAIELVESSQKYFRRREIPRIESQLEDAMFDCWQAVQAMTATHKAPRAVRNPDACFRWGSVCQFWTICSLGVDPETLSTLRRLPSPHPELSQGDTNEPETSSAA